MRRWRIYNIHGSRYTHYLTKAWRNKSFGQALEFVWAQDSNEYAIRESTSRVRLFKNFKEKNTLIRFGYSAEGIFGGNLLAIKSSGFIIFYDWETGAVVRRVDVNAKKVFWSESDLVCIASEEGFYILKYNRASFQTGIENGTADEEGVEEVSSFLKY